MKEKSSNYFEKTARFFQDIKIGEKVLFVLFITMLMALPLILIEGINPIIYKILFIFTMISAFTSGIAIFGYILYVLFLKRYLDIASNTLETVSKVKDVHRLIKAPNFTKAKEVFSKVKGFKMPKFEIKKNIISKWKTWKKGKKDV